MEKKIPTEYVGTGVSSSKRFVIRNSKGERGQNRLLGEIKIHNKSEEAPISCCIFAEKKSRNDEWKPLNEVFQKNMKIGEIRQINLHSDGTANLFEHLKKYLVVAKKHGPEYGFNEYTITEGDIEKFVSAGDEELDSLLSKNPKQFSKLLSKLISRMGSTEKLNRILEVLISSEIETLGNFYTSYSIKKLKKVLDFWEDNKENSKEREWQNFFKNNQLMFQQLFITPITSENDEFLVGGTDSRKGSGQVVDFLVKNSLTCSAKLIEIKAPTTKIIGKAYRKTYSLSSEINGAVNQVIKYRDTLQKEYANRFETMSENNITVFNPECIVIAGNLNSELRDKPEGRGALELFRTQLKDVRIVTFDELFGRINSILSSLTLDHPSTPA